MNEKVEGLSKTALSAIKKAKRACREDGHFVVDVGKFKIEIFFDLRRMCTVNKMLVNEEEIDVYDLGYIDDSEPSRELDHGYRQFIPYAFQESYIDKEKYSEEDVTTIGLVAAEAIDKIPIYYDDIGDSPKNAAKKGDIVRRFIIKTDGVELEITRSATEYCMLDKLLVNGSEISLFDIGTVKDVEPQRAKGYGCGHRKFIPHGIATLQKKNDVITLEEMIAAGKVLERMIDYKDCPKCR